MIIPFTRINKDGKEVQFFTHSNYLPQDKLDAINQGSQSRNVLCNYIGLAGAFATYYAVQIPTLRKAIPAKIPSLALALAGFFVTGSLAGMTLRGYQSSELRKLIESSTVPLWSNQTNVVNPERAFFELSDSNGQRINLLHQGISPENVANIFPTSFTGTPKAPEHLSNAHGHSSHH